MISRRVRLDVWRVARELLKPERMPTRKEYNRHGRFTVYAVEAGGTWRGAAEEIGLAPNKDFSVIFWRFK